MVTKSTLKAISRRILSGLDSFSIGRRVYYVNFERKTVLYYLFGDNPQIIYFDELPFDEVKEV